MITRVVECGSTQDLAWASPSPTLPHGEFFIAERQTAGRGRAAGRFWVSPPGGLYLSWRLNDVDPNGFTLLGGLAVARALKLFGAEPWLKWPNDCWVGRAKIAGVLSDCRWSGQTLLGLVLGIGVNVQVAEPPEGATSLHLCCQECPSVEHFSQVLIQELLQGLDVHRQKGLAGYLDEVRTLSLPAGSLIRYWQGEQSHEDSVRGLDDQGFLLLASGERLMAVDRLELR